ncbi:MAG TPA: family 43 glycosylhydrolase, partial [Acidimicrobiales bacterium]|nr:family 43 glycosylhydrolase [Acidimicrobiales bacterium]
MRKVLVAVALVAAAMAGLPPGPTAALNGPGPTKPVWARSYPDPFVLPVDGTYYAYATDGDLGEVQVIESTDLVTWSKAGTGEALGEAPDWAEDDDVWAPAVTRLSATSYVLYAAFERSDTGERCIGAATSSSPEGPFDAVDSFELCRAAQGGVIDPSVFVSGATRYLLWKTEGVPGNNQEPPSVYSQPLAPSGLSLTGQQARIFRSEQPWEGTLVENPSMISEGTRTYLFYSGNEWESAAYGIGWAACAGPQGPCIAPPNRPLMTSEPNILGPGGGAHFRDDSGIWMAFAAWSDPTRVTEDSGGQRALFLRRVRFVGGRPQITGPDGAFREPAFTTRAAGINRYDTASAFSAMTTQQNRPVTYVATGIGFQDALIAAPASGFEDSPVLLLQPTAIPQSVKVELARLHPGHIVVMGDTAAISDAVYDELRQYSGGSIHREAGIDQYHRSALVSRNTFDPGVPVAYVATGRAFPDGLAGGAAGAANDGPLLFVKPDEITIDVRNELDRLDPKRIVVLGGTAAVSDAVFNALKSYSGTVQRVAGANRYETAAALAGQFTKVNGSVAA